MFLGEVKYIHNNTVCLQTFTLPFFRPQFTAQYANEWAIMSTQLLLQKWPRPRKLCTTTMYRPTRTPNKTVRICTEWNKWNLSLQMTHRFWILSLSMMLFRSEIYNILKMSSAKLPMRVSLWSCSENVWSCVLFSLWQDDQTNSRPV